MDTGLIQLISVDKEKCVNCHKCISVCPVKYCNDGSGDAVVVNSDTCLACGTCLDACTHEARTYLDDASLFFGDLEKEKIVGIVAPSVAASFPNQYLKLNTWLKSLGVKAIFDVSFGAELTTKSYFHYLQNQKPKTIIAQPCASIVTYIELYQPELLPFLAPVHSPMLHTITMIKHFYPEYIDHKVVVISPCLAKKREFEETGLGNYNVSYKSIQKHIEQNGINLNDFAESEYDNPPAERAVMFSTPGGLLETASRWDTSLRRKSRKIEGVDVVYDYMTNLKKMLDENKAPMLIDCLNCKVGCNGGPLTLVRNKPLDEIEWEVEERKDKLVDFYKQQKDSDEKLSIEEVLNKYWDEKIFKREYVNRSKNIKLRYPDNDELTQIYLKMHKFTNSDIYNCASCGYGTCEKMGVAIFNGLNRPENCHFYLLNETKNSHEEILKSKEKFEQMITTTSEGFVQVDKTLRIIAVNPTFAKMLQHENLTEKYLTDFLDEKNRNIVKHQAEMRKQGKQAVYELEFTNTKGEKIACMLNGTPLYNEKREVIGSFAMIADITELKQMQKNLLEMNQKLEEKVEARTKELKGVMENLKTQNDEIAVLNEELQQGYEEIQMQKENLEGIVNELEKLSIATSKTDNAIFIFNIHNEIEWVNESFSKLFDLTLSEIKFKNITLQSLNIILNLEQVLAKCIELKNSVSFETHVIKNDLTVQWLQVSITPLFDVNNNVNRYVLVCSDINKLKEFQVELETRQVEMEEINNTLNLKNISIQQSIEYATTIQKNILPNLKEISKTFENHIIYLPKDIVSGDFYWYKQLVNHHENSLSERFMFVVCDCTGHGVPGAFMTLIAYKLLEDIVVNQEIDAPEKVLEFLDLGINRILKQDSNRSNDGMDLSICLIEKDKNNTITGKFAAAKENIYHYNSLTQNLQMLKGTRRSIGGVRRLHSPTPFTCIEFSLHTNDHFYMFSDGLVDQNDKERHFFGEKRLEAILEQKSSEGIAHLGEELTSQLNKFKQGTFQRDDITFWAIKI